MSQPDAAPTPADAPPPRKTKRRRRKWPRRLLIAAAAVVVLLAAIVVLLPTLLSTAAGRNAVVSYADGMIPGRLEIADLSLGWFSGAKAGGVKVYDEDGRLVLEVDRLDTGLTLLDALTPGSLDLGNAAVVANATRLEVEPDGTTNYARLLTPESDSDEPVVLPDITGDVALDLRGMIFYPGPDGGQRFVKLLPTQGKAAIDGQKYALELPLPLESDDQTGSIGVAGGIDLETLFVKGRVTFGDLPLQLAEPALRLAGVDQTFAGTLSGEVVAESENGVTTISGEPTVTDFAAGNVAGQTVTAGTLALPIDAEIGESIVVNRLAVVIDGDEVVTATLDVSRAALQGPATTLPPDATADLAVNLPPDKLAVLAAFAPEAYRPLLRDAAATAGVKLAGGAADVALDFRSSDQPLVTLDANLSDLALGDAVAGTFDLRELRVSPALAGRLPAELPVRVDGDDLVARGGGRFDLAAGTFTPDDALTLATDGLTVATETQGVLLANQPVSIEQRGVVNFGETTSVENLRLQVGGGTAGLLREAQIRLADVRVIDGGVAAGVDIEVLRTADLEQLAALAGGDVPVTASGDVLVRGAAAVDTAAGTLVPDESRPIEVVSDRLSVAYDGADLLVDQPLAVALIGPASWGDVTTVGGVRASIGEGRGAVTAAELALSDVRLGEAGTTAAFNVRRLAIADVAAAARPFVADLPVEIAGGSLTVEGAGAFDSADTAVTLSRPLSVAGENLTIRQDGQPLLDGQDATLALAGGSAGDVLTLDPLALTIDGGQTLAVTATGRVETGEAATVLDDVKAVVSYDLGRLTPLLRGVLGETFADAEFAGRSEQTYTISGTIPADAEGVAMLRGLTASGGLRIDRVLAAGGGLDLRDLNLNVALDNGGVAVRQPRPASLNNGELRLDGLNVDVTGDEPLLFVSRPRAVLNEVQLTPGLIGLVEPYFGRFLQQTGSTAGTLTFTIDSSRGLPLSAAALKTGTADTTLTIRQLDVESDLLGLAAGAVASAVSPGQGGAGGGGGANDLIRGLGELAKLGGADGPLAGVEGLSKLDGLADIAAFNRLRGFIDSGDIRLEQGVLRQDVTLNVFDVRDPAGSDVYPLTLRGAVDLDTLAIDQTLLLPKALMQKWLPDELAAVVPEGGLPVRYTGTTSAPIVALAGNGRGLLENALRDLIAREAGDNLGKELGGNEDVGRAVEGILRGTQDGDVQGALEGVLRGLGDRRKKDQESQESQE